jgi:putative RecB family exonuclease
VHRVLELLFMHPPAARTIATATTCFRQAVDEYAVDPDFTLLHLDDARQQAFIDDSWTLVEAYFRMEDPTAIREIGIELRLEAQVGPLALRGIIDRLELDDDGELVVTDYKTGAVPNERAEQDRLGGVHFYSLLCDRLFGRRPVRVQLMYLSRPEVLSISPSEQSVTGMERRALALYAAVERACARDDFRPNRSRLCDWCNFQAFCPAWGGDPEQAVALRPEPVLLPA